MNNKYFGNLIPNNMSSNYQNSKPPSNPWLESNECSSTQLALESEEHDVSYHREILLANELRSLGSENELRYIYRNVNIYMIKIQKTQYFEYYGVKVQPFR